ncbi:putative N6-adenine-specific DNA methylase [Chitinophaga polysaccharea]|uniref:Putative N6-adenine-specific DNA methylase n=1 Tax=Chitinophaga polysaccharea TaxID=1293035 RepID=A0A561PX71_9BACT|nr:class I SAM-dependent RNA methyltransferase [Chitinophaga polysaccharea]TWF42706.1 putative N6-adenine-specific DNA methylase [Chitinophaga polysaccharea]
MSLYTTTGTVTVTCNKRLTPFLEQEVKELGFTIDETFVTGVRLQASVNECIRLNLQLRCGSQVLYSLKQFEATDADDIYQALHSYPWETILPADGYFSITSNVQNDTINNSMFANLRVKDAVVDRLRAETGKRPSTGAELSGAVIHLFWKNEKAEVFVDTSGDSLARHGYRKIPGRAPMLEALAASTILATKWDCKSPFINPMCGSGTVAIEAALIATNSRPGLFRENYAFMHLQGYNEDVYLEERGILEKQIVEVPGLRIIATDLSDMAIVNARKNAKAAGVQDMIEFRVCDFAATEVPANAAGVVYMNPEYGLRLGEIEALEETYGRIGDFLKQRCGGYHGYVFTGNLELAKKIGLKAKRRIEFYNSTIDCRLLEYELYAGTRDARKLAGDKNDE